MALPPFERGKKIEKVALPFLTAHWIINSEESRSNQINHQKEVKRVEAYSVLNIKHVNEDAIII